MLSVLPEVLMTRNARFVLVFGGNGLVALSAVASLVAYASHDPSGLQYICLVPAAWLAGLAIAFGAVLAMLSLRRPRPWANLGIGTIALLTAAPWTASGIGDLPGGILAAALLPLAVVVTVVVVRGLNDAECSL